MLFFIVVSGAAMCDVVSGVAGAGVAVDGVLGDAGGGLMEPALVSVVVGGG